MFLSPFLNVLKSFSEWPPFKRLEEIANVAQTLIQMRGRRKRKEREEKKRKERREKKRKESRKSFERRAVPLIPLIAIFSLGKDQPNLGFLLLEVAPRWNL